MSSKLHQLTMSYSPKEDRILLRIGTAQNTEYRLWLIRRFVRSIWGALKKILEGSLTRGNDMQPKVRQAVMAMEHQESVQSSDFTRKHSTKKMKEADLSGTIPRVHSSTSSRTAASTSTVSGAA